MRLENSVQAAPEARTAKVEFHGSGGEYFKIWIVNIFLSILTLGIYSAWAKVRNKRYFYGNTRLDNASFEYHAKPITILKGRLIAVAALVLVTLLSALNPIAYAVAIVLLIVLAPWVIWRSMIFNARMSSYRNVRFGFTGKASGLYVILALVPIGFLVGGAIVAGGLGLVAKMLGLFGGEMNQVAGIAAFGAVIGAYACFPYLQKSLNSYYFNHHLFGQGKFKARLEASFYYIVYLKLFGIFILLSLVFGIIGAGVAMLFGGGTNISPEQVATTQSPLVILIFVPLIAFGVWTKAYIATRFRNYSVGKLQLQSAATFRSNMKVMKLFWIQFTNILLLIVTLGLGWPWAIVRLTRYKLETIRSRLYGDIDQYVTQAQKKQSALGEELGEAFDLDLDIGL